MKRLLAFLALCVTAWSYTPAPALADAPQPGTLEIALVKDTVTVGEPLVLKYRVSNPEDRRVDVSISDDVPKWLKVRLRDASGHPVQGAETTEDVTLLSRHFIAGTVPIGPKGQKEGFLVLSQNLQPVQAGQYQLDLSAHLAYAWGRRDIALENTKSEQSFSLPLTVTAKDPQRLREVAESLRQTVLHDGRLDEYRLADKALFSMRDPACVPVWRALATDANLDPWKTADVIDQLKEVGSPSACDVLAEMQTVAPERWLQTGIGPLVALEQMWRPAGPATKQYINQLLAEAGVPPVSERTRVVGTMH